MAVLSGSAAIGHGPPSETYEALDACLYLVPAALCILRAVLVREERFAWAVLGIGMACWAAAFGNYFLFLQDLKSPPYPSVSDAFWLISYPCIVVGLLALMRARLVNFRRSLWIDAAVGGLAIAAAGAALLVGPILDATGGSVAAVATNLAYPLFDGLILSLVIGVLFMSGGLPGRAWMLLGAIFVAFGVNDAVYLYQTATGTYHSGTLMDAIAPACMLLVALVAWQKPTLIQGRQVEGWPAVALTSGFALVGLGLTTYDHWHPVNDAALVLAMLTMLAAFVRTAMTFADMRSRDARSLAASRKLLERHELLLNAAGEGIYGVDGWGAVTFVNPMAARLTGYEPAELIGQPLHPMIHHTRADGSPYPIEECPVTAALRDGLVHHDDGDVYWRKDGSSFAVEFTSTPVREDDHVTGAVVVFKDVTARKAMEAELQRNSRFFDLSHDLVCTLDPEGRFTQVNAAWTRTLGWSESELLGHPYTEFLHPDDWDAAAQEVGQSTEGGSNGEIVNRHRTKQGEWRWLEWTYPSGPQEGLVYASARDITERKRVEVELAGAHEKALEASRLKSEFLANMSHEIRTPLNGVIGAGGLLRATELDEEQREYVEAVSASGEALMSVISDILDFSKIEAGKLELDRHRFELREVVEDVLLMLATSAHDKDLELIAWVEEDLPDTMYGDSVRVRQVLTNFATNAVKFTAAGDVVVRVTAEPIGVRFAVTDTGIGVQRDALERIFDAFSQADNSTTRRYGGTGLGLAICRQLVDLMGGRFGVESEPGVGSTFWFTIPLTPVFVEGSGRRRPDFEGARVLVADEYLTSRVILDHQLSAWNIACDTAASSDEAMRLLSRAELTGRPYALAIIDVRTPCADGMALARGIKAKPALRATRLLMLSPSAAMREAATDAGIEGFLTKPIRQLRLAQEIGRLLGRDDVAQQRDGGRWQPASHRPIDRGVGRSVLVAEDNTVNQLVAVRMLEQRGFRVDLAPDGRAAVRMHATGAYDLIFMDCQMPELDGYEATGEIRRAEAHGGHTPIIAMTANTLKGDRERCLAAGMDDYVGKPLRSTELEAVIARGLALADDAGVAGTLAALLPGAPRVVEPDPAEPLLDPTVLSEVFEDDQEAQAAVVAEFRTRSRAVIEELARAIDSGDAAAAGRLAHGLQGSSAVVGASRLARMAGGLCEILRAGALGQARRLQAEFEHTFDLTDEVLLAHLTETSR